MGKKTSEKKWEPKFELYNTRWQGASLFEVFAFDILFDQEKSKLLILFDICFVGGFSINQKLLPSESHRQTYCRKNLETPKRRQNLGAPQHRQNLETNQSWQNCKVVYRQQIFETPQRRKISSCPKHLQVYTKCSTAASKQKKNSSKSSNYFT